MKPDAPCRIEKIAKTQGVLSDKYYLTSPARLSATRYTLTSLSKFVEKIQKCSSGADGTAYIRCEGREWGDIPAAVYERTVVGKTR